MKKLGFTLAEVLIAIGLVGVISAMTIPTFIADSRQQSHEAKASATMTDLENAFSTMLVAELVDTYPQTRFASRNMNRENLNRYIRVAREGNMATFYGGNVNFRGDDCNGNLAINPRIVFELKNGSLLMAESATRMFLDTNGRTTPNCLNRDIYNVNIDDNGFITRPNFD